MGTLAIAISLLSALGPWRGLRTGIEYTPVLAIFITDHEAALQWLHDTLVFNIVVACHIDMRKPIMTNKLYLMTAASRAAAQKLFFTSAVMEWPHSQIAMPETAGGQSTQCDTFLQTERVSSVVGGGFDPMVLLREITSNLLALRLPSGTGWSLYPLYPYLSVSSAYPFDAADLRAVCTKDLDTTAECSFHMTPQFRRAHAHTRISVSTLRVMRAALAHTDALIDIT